MVMMDLCLFHEYLNVLSLFEKFFVSEKLTGV